MSDIGVGHKWETVISTRPSKNRTRVVCLNCGFRTYFTPDLSQPFLSRNDGYGPSRYSPPSDCQEYIVRNIMAE